MFGIDYYGAKSGLDVQTRVEMLVEVKCANEMITMAAGGVNTVFASRTFVRQGGQAVRARARHVGTCRAWGRIITRTKSGYVATYNYRFGDKLKDIMSNFPGEAATVYYNYDGLGKRRNKTLDLATATWWRWDLGYNVIQEYTDPDADWDIENLAATFVPGLAEIPGGDPSTGSYRYYMTDHLGSVRTLREQNKAALASYEFMPYGETYLQSDRELYRGFTGYMIDEVYYAPFRYYSPVASRWLTSDPLGMKAGLNLYEYGKDRPLLLTDPLGLQPQVKVIEICMEKFVPICLAGLGRTYALIRQCIKVIVDGQCIVIPDGVKCGEDPCLRGGPNPNDKNECEAATDMEKAYCKQGPTPACLISIITAIAVCSSPPDGGPYVPY